MLELLIARDFEYHICKMYEILDIFLLKLHTDIIAPNMSKRYFVKKYGTKYSRMDQAEGEWKTAFKNLKGYGLLARLSSTNFTWSFLEYFVPYSSH